MEGEDKLRAFAFVWPEAEALGEGAGEISDGLCIGRAIALHVILNELQKMAVQEHDLCEHLRFCQQGCFFVAALLAQE